MKTLFPLILVVLCCFPGCFRPEPTPAIVAPTPPSRPKITVAQAKQNYEIALANLGILRGELDRLERSLHEGGRERAERLSTAILDNDTETLEAMRKERAESDRLYVQRYVGLKEAIDKAEVEVFAAQTVLADLLR